MQHRSRKVVINTRLISLTLSSWDKRLNVHLSWGILFLLLSLSCVFFIVQTSQWSLTYLFFSPLLLFNNMEFKWNGFEWIEFGPGRSVTERRAVSRCFPEFWAKIFNLPQETGHLAHFFICLYFTTLITLLLLLLLFVFISLKHNKLQMIYWGYHNCYGNLELSTDLWFKAKHGFIVNTATDEEKKTLERLGLREQRLISDINILKT